MTTAVAGDVSYKVLIGMEIHVELATQSKMFTGAANVAAPGNADAAPNSLTDPIVLGMPGVLPVINKKAVEYAMRVGLGLNCEIAGFTKWDRKSYYYPDLPKNYQISQYDLPLCGEGKIEIPLPDGSTKSIRIRRAHLEEDAGKLLHEGHDDFSQVDLNRAGTPLLEIVTEPDLSTPEEARIFGEELRRICRYLGVTQGIMQQGHMRFEPNINLHIFADGKTFKTPICELKNLNSFRAVERSCTYEITRQLAEWHSKGGPNQNPNQKVGKFTLGWNDDKGVTTIQRSKEAAEDYRYFPDPDLVPLHVSREWVEQVKKEVVELPIPRRRRYEKEYALSAKESTMLVDERPVAELFEATIAKGAIPRRVVNIMLQKAGAIANERGVLISELPVTPDQYASLAKLVEDGTISATAAATIFDDLLNNIGADPKATAEKLGVIQVRDVGATEKWVDQAIAANPEAVDTYKNNPKKKDASLGFLRGKVMAISQRKADPKLVGELLLKKLGA